MLITATWHQPAEHPFCTCRRQDKLQEAEQQLKESLTFFPKYAAAHSALGQVGPAVQAA